MSDVQTANPTPPFRPAGVGATGATGPTGATGTQAEHDARVAAHAAERQKVIAAETAAKAKIAAERKAKGFSGEYVASLVAVLNYIADRAHIRGQEYNTLIGELADYADPVAVAKPEETKAATGATGTTGAAGFSPIPR